MWSAAEPRRTRTLSLKTQEPPSEGCGGAPGAGQLCTHSSSRWNGLKALGWAQKHCRQRGRKRPRWPRWGSQARTGHTVPSGVSLAWAVSPSLGALPSPEAAAALMTVLVLGPAGVGTAHGGDRGGTQRDADEAALLEEGCVVISPWPLHGWGQSVSQPGAWVLASQAPGQTPWS